MDPSKNNNSKQQMSNLGRRLRYYGIGFGFGTLFVIMFFGARGCSWTPGNRVKTGILQRVIAVPTQQQKNLESKEITSKNLIDFIADADVDFKHSKKQNPNKFYKLTKDKTTLYFTLPNDSYVSSVYTSRPNEKQTGKAKLMRFPDGKDLIFTDTTGSLQRIRVELGFKDDRSILEQLKKNAYLNYDKSDFLNTIKPEHYLEFETKKGDTVEVISVWYKDKINITKYIYKGTLQ